MKIDIYKIPNNKILTISSEVIFDNDKYKFSYPLTKINKCFVTAKIKKYEDFINVHLNVSADVRLICSYSLKEFDYDIDNEDDFNFSNLDSDIDNDFIIYKGNRIDLDDYIYELIISSVPTSPIAPNAKLPKSGSGYRVLTEEELLKEESQKGNDKFDILNDLDFD